MASFTVTRVNDPRSAAIVDIVPDVFPTLPAVTPDTDRVYEPTVTYQGGVANLGNDSDNYGEIGTPRQTDGASVPYITQKAKADALGVGMAQDITRGYGAAGRGPIDPLEPYPSGNVAPTNITLTPATIPVASAAGTDVGVLSTTDANPGDTFTYALVNNAGGMFALEAPATIAVGATALTVGAKTIRVRSTDIWGLSFEKDITVTVT